MITIQHNQRHKQKERKNKQTKYKQNTDSIKTICKWFYIPEWLELNLLDIVSNRAECIITEQKKKKKILNKIFQVS